MFLQKCKVLGCDVIGLRRREDQVWFKNLLFEIVQTKPKNINGEDVLRFSVNKAKDPKFVVPRKISGSS